ncbi:MAG: 50S ribosomal protein L4 [Candidatus Poribacteria bacterium]|nr:50S ribosomal protein L4 [Candidatus Poribacteria bacterium]
MKQLEVQNQSGAAVSTVDVPDLLAEGKVNGAVLHQVVVAHLANQRQGNQATKTRAQVAGSGKKLFRQKGLGRARMGDIRSPIRVGGGTIFGPQPRSYRQYTPKKMRRVALVSALRAKFQEKGAVKVVNEFPGADQTPKTKAVVAALKAIGAGRKKTLIVLPEPNVWVYRSAKNLPKVTVTTADLVNTFEILHHDIMVLLPGSVDGLMKRAGGASEAEAS